MWDFPHNKEAAPVSPTGWRLFSMEKVMALTVSQLDVLKRKINSQMQAFATDGANAESLKVIVMDESITGADLFEDVIEQLQNDHGMALMNAFLLLLEGTIGSTGKTGYEIANKFILS